MIVGLSNFKKLEYKCPDCGIEIHELRCNVDEILVYKTKCFPAVENLLTENRKLLQELSEARETNRRLNRRCQQLESKNTKLNKILEAARAIHAALKGLI